MAWKPGQKGAWVACRQVTFNGVVYQPEEVLLPAGAEWPCDMKGLEKSGLAMFVLEGQEMWRPHVSAHWRLRELGPAALDVPEPPPPPPAEPEVKPDPPPVPAVEPAATPAKPQKQSKRKSRRRRSWS